MCAMATTAQDTVTLVEALYDLYNSHQSDPAWLDKSLAFFAQDCEIIDVPSGMTTRGPDGYKQLILFFEEGFPGSRIEITNLIATEDQAVVEFVGRGTNTGSLHLPTGDLPPTGRAAELWFCDVYRLRSGKIVRYRSYYDALGFMQQPGLIPSLG
jgi:predicted ester cyclase